MGIVTIDIHRHKVHTKLYKIPKFGVNRPKCQIYKEMYGRLDAGHTFLC